MAMEFLRKKWEVHFLANDLDKDGVMTVADANILAERFIKHHNRTGEKARHLKTVAREIWNSMFLLDQEEIDLKTYLDLKEKEFKENRTKFIEKVSRAQKDTVDLIDVDNDGLLTGDEYVLACSFWGIDNPDPKDLQFYPQVKPGYVSKKLFNDSWIAFMTNDDVTKADIEKPVRLILRMADDM